MFEIALRILGWGEITEFAPNEKWGYLMKPSQRVYSYGHPVIINRNGLRGTDFKKTKAQEDVLRILYVGDSTTYGGGRIKEGELFCRIPEPMLNEDNYKAETINLSAPGWSPQNWIKYIEANGLFHADLVVVVLPECDLARQFATMEIHDFREEKPLLRLESVFLKLYYVFLTKTGFRGKSNNNPEKNVKSNIRALMKLTNLCKEKNKECLTVFIPSVPASEYKKYWPQFETSVKGTLLDLRDELNDTSLFMDGYHLNTKGHKLVGELLYKELTRILKLRNGEFTKN